jgi:hypothetical protein
MSDMRNAPSANWTRLKELHGDHFAQLYRDEKDLVEQVRIYSRMVFNLPRQGLLFLATREHCHQFRQAIAADGADVAGLMSRGQLSFMPIEEILPLIMNGRAPLAAMFESVAKGLLERSERNGQIQHVHVFGEIVDHLWQSGNPVGTLQLERLWNAVRRTRSFTLYCAFHVEHDVPTALAGPMRHALFTHDSLIHHAAGAGTVLSQLADVAQQDLTAGVPEARPATPSSAHLA